MEKNRHVYFQLFWSAFQLSAFTVGSGYVIIALMRKKFVEQLRWIDEREMLDLTAIAQSAPGAVVVNAAFLVGYRVAGYAGALLTVLGTVLPPVLVITAVSFCYEAFCSNAVVAAALGGMRAGVAAIICDVVLTMGGSLFKDRRALPVLLFAGAFLANRVLGVNAVLIILACGAIGAADRGCREKRGQGQK